MKKSIFKKLGALFLGLSMAAGVGVSIGTVHKNASSVYAGLNNTPVYSSGTPSFGSSYAGNVTKAMNDISWTFSNVGNNTSMGWNKSSQNHNDPSAPLTTMSENTKIGGVQTSGGWKVGKIVVTVSNADSVTGTWYVWYSTNSGSSWTLGTSASMTSGTTSFTYDHGSNIGDSVRFAFGYGTSKTSGTRVNLSNIQVYQYEEAAAQIPYSYNLGGATGTTPASGTKEAGTSLTLASAPSWTGHTFNGWSDGSNTYAAGSSYTMPTSGSVTFTAQWTTNTYTVSGTIGNGELSSTSSISYGSQLNITINPNENYTYPETLTLVKMGGSTLTADSGYTYDNSTGAISIASVTGNVVINATCVPLGTAYTVTYDANGGSVSTTSEQIIENGNPSFPTPTRSGFNFKGWQVDGSGTLYTESSEYPVTEDVKFVASWAALYTVSFDSNGGSASPASMQVEDGSTFSFPSAGTKTHYTFDGWSSDGGTNKYESGTSPAVTANTTYTAYWVENAKYTVTYVAGSSSYDHENQYSGSYTLLDFASTGLTVPDGYRFKDYTVNGEHKEAKTSINLTGATTVRANFEVMPRVDTLNRDFTGIKDGSTTYAGWSNKTGTSGAVYAGQSAGGNDSIQLRSTSPAGIITTTSGGTVRKVTVVWNSNTPSGRTIDIYGKNSAYVESANLYASDSATKGTKLGSIVYGTSTELIITGETGDYEYIGIRSNSGALYLTEVQIEWEAPNALSSVAVSFDNDPADRTFVAGNTFEFKGTLTASYTKDEDAEVTPASYHLNSESGTAITSSTVLTIADHNGKSVYVVYTEDGVTKSDSFTLIVNYAPVTSLTISQHAAKIGLDSAYDHTEIDVTINTQYADQGYEWDVYANTVGDDFEFDPELGLFSGKTAGTITLRCSSTADSTKYDDLVITVSANPTAAFTPTSVSGYVGKNTNVAFTYGNIDDVSLISITSANESCVTTGTVTADNEEGSVVVNFISEGSTTISIYYGGGTTPLATVSVTANADSVKAVYWTASDIKVYSGAVLPVEIEDTWEVNYETYGGEEDYITHEDFDVILGEDVITLPYTWSAEDDGKTLCVKYGEVSSETVNVDVTQTLRPIMFDVLGEESTKTWNASKDCLGSTIKTVGDTATGTLKFDDNSSMSYTRTLDYVKSGKADYVAFSDPYAQFGSSNALEKLELGVENSENVSKVVVTCWAKDGATNVTVTVGGNVFDSVKAAPSSGDTLEFNGLASGNIVITMEKGEKTAGCAQYIASVAITTVEATGEQIDLANVAGHEDAQKAVVKFAKAFNAALDNSNNCADLGSDSEGAWKDATTAWATFNSDISSLSADEQAYAKNLIKYATAQYTKDTDDNYEYCLERAVATYEICVRDYSMTAFMDGVRAISSNRRINPIIALSNVDTSVWVISAVAVAGLTAIGGYFFYRKRKEI